ncbi:NUDIX hydrolase [Paenibacillus sp. UNC451MF]|uniref:NUDIX hydrolase n=1 Tax=Paenibacillus sp. UNC451MF TaxID=1449063 RepID=UPI00048D6F2C|nr:NUDIX hydrolase [Paenibacillus sp. UNC451MF]
MLTFISDLPTDRPIAGVHCVPILGNGNMMMVWDKDEQTLTTIGGRVEDNETLEEALYREVMEEAGIRISGEAKPFACWYWEETDTYTVYFLTRVQSYDTMPEGFEKTGYVIMNFQTAIQLITKLEGTGARTDIIARAEALMEPYLSCK